MIPSTPIAKAAALILSGAMIVGASHVNNTPQAPEIKGGGEVAIASLGNSFADLSAGTLAALQPQEITPAAQQQPIAAQPITPSTSAAPTPAQPLRPTTAAKPIAPTQPQSAAPMQAALAPSPAPQTITATPSESAAPVRSTRPKLRDPALAPKPKPTATGNANRNAKRGTSTGNRSATANRQGVIPSLANPGNAAASNYPGKVRGCINRVPSPRGKGRGVARVTFSVNARGRFNNIRITRSSGLAALDAAALNMIRRASPCAKPPSGAQRQFTIGVRGT